MAPDTPPTATTRLVALIAGEPKRTAAILAFSLAGWSVLGWMALDMGHPLVQLAMPEGVNWTAANATAIFAMWAIMMAAMMLPASLPVVLAFVHLSRRGGERGRARAFVAAYLLVWWAFSAIAAMLQWALQAAGWIDTMRMASTSAWLTALLLVIAGVYQFSPLKKVCLGRCRTPVGFLLGEWRPGVGGAFHMGVRHGVFCAGCCWALMVLLFVGGVMNIAWVAALAVGVAIEKMAPGGERIATLLGFALVAAGAVKLAAALAA